MNLVDLLNKKQCFKVVCGAGNEDTLMVEKLVAVYAKAGARYFDLSAEEDVVLAAKKGIARVIPPKQRQNYFLNVSVGIKGDPHLQKAQIDLEKCRSCGACKIVCLQRAIKNENRKYFVIEKKCLGCGACFQKCKFNAVSFYDKKRDLNHVLPPLVKLGLSSIELHAITDNEEEAFEQWQMITKHFKGILSLCLDRSHLGDLYLINRIKRFIRGRKDFTTIIQADGAPMSGSSDNYQTTLQALATADIVQKANLPVFILMSGGTNSQTTKLAKLFEVRAHGVSIGSFARKIIDPYLHVENFLEDKKAFAKAVFIAKKLVDQSLKYLG